MSNQVLLVTFYIATIVEAIKNGQTVANDQTTVNFYYGGWSLLHYAVDNERIDVIEDLLRNGANIDCQALDPDSESGFDSTSTPKLILAAKYPWILEELNEKMLSSSFSLMSM